MYLLILFFSVTSYILYYSTEIYYSSLLYIHCYYCCITGVRVDQEPGRSSHNFSHFSRTFPSSVSVLSWQSLVRFFFFSIVMSIAMRG